MVKFKRENRYFVVKVSDAEKYLSELDLIGLEHYMRKIDRGRINDCRGSFPACAVAESDWPEYELLWKAIEKRVKESA